MSKCTAQGRSPHKSYPTQTVGDVGFGLSFSACHICDLMSEHCNSITLFKINSRFQTGLRHVRKRLPVKLILLTHLGTMKLHLMHPANCIFFLLNIFSSVDCVCMSFLFDQINNLLRRADDTFR